VSLFYSSGVNDRISFKKFLGLTLDKLSPDHSTFSRFWSRISKEAMIELNNAVPRETHSIFLWGGVARVCQKGIEYKRGDTFQFPDVSGTYKS